MHLRVFPYREQHLNSSEILVAPACTLLRCEAVDSSLADAFPNMFFFSFFPFTLLGREFNEFQLDFGSDAHWLAPPAVRGCRFQLSQRFFEYALLFVQEPTSKMGGSDAHWLAPSAVRGCRFQLSQRFEYALLFMKEPNSKIRPF